MTEMETLKRAKLYMDKLAQGTDPLTDQPVSDSDCIRKARISRCLSYVSDVLGRLIASNGRGNIWEKQPFAISHEALKQFPISDAPLTVAEIAQRISALVDPLTMASLKPSSINTFLVQSGFLTVRQNSEGVSEKVPTERGRSIGISTVELQNPSFRIKHVTVFNADAQRFILDNIDSVIGIDQPWTQILGEELTKLFRQGVPASEIAARMERTEGSVTARLQKLKLIKK